MPVSRKSTRVWRCVVCIAMACSPLLAAAPKASKVSASVLRESEALVARSVVRINRLTSYRSGTKQMRAANFGTGVIIGEQEVNGHREYLILSNEHVAKNNHVPGRNTLSIAAGYGVKAPIPLETLAVDVHRDQALLRTVKCSTSFTVPHYIIGPPQGDARQETAFTEGYGNGKFNMLPGDILSTQSKDWDLRCYRFDVPVGAGQSGAPLVVIGSDGRLYLPALIFCGNDQFTDATPLRPGEGVLRRLTPKMETP